MTRIFPLIASLALLAGLVPTGVGAASAPVGFGMDSASMAAQANAGVKADYGTFWIGPWTLQSGWGGPDAQLDAMKAAGVTPAVHFYYWGDAIAQACFGATGCWSSLQNTQLTMAGWQTLAQQLVDHLNARLGGTPAMVFVETEFNKGDVASWAPIDGYMADKATFIHQNYPAAKVVMPLGNWNSGAWPTYSRFAAASDFVGIQGMRGSTRDSLTSYLGLYDAVLAGARTLQSLFHKPVVLQDIALSSYPEPGYLQDQSDALQRFFTGMADLKAAGVQVIIYRSWLDSPTMSTANYYGIAERYWGLANAASWKPAATVWVDGVKAERAAGAATPPTASLAATASGLTVAVDGSASTPGSGGALSYSFSFGDGATASGPTASHTYAAAGSYTVTLTVGNGAGSASASKAVTVTAPPPPPPPAPLAATFTLGSVNQWWVDVKVASASTIASVSATVDGGAPHALAKTSWGSWAASFYVAKGASVVFTARDASGSSAVSPAFPWLRAAPAPAPAPAPSFTATFTPKAVGNDWWVEVGVTSSSGIAKVEASLNGGAYVQLPLDSWGTYAKSLNAPNGTQVVFRATSSTGATATSPAVTWT